jgi:hypothetical protein
MLTRRGYEARENARGKTTGVVAAKPERERRVTAVRTMSIVVQP